DREHYRRSLAKSAAVQLSSNGSYTHRFGPRVGMRWWLLVAGVAGGLATGVKWSGLYAVAVFGLVAVAWNLSARRAIGVPGWVGGGTWRDGAPAFLMMVPPAAAAYLAT